MNLQDIINDLKINNAKTDGTHYTVDQLKTISSQVSVNVSKAVRHNNQRALRRMHGIPVTRCLLVIAPYHFC